MPVAAIRHQSRATGLDPLLVPVVGPVLRAYNLGASVVHFLRPSLHLMCETVAVWDPELLPNGTYDHTFEFLLSPGARRARYTEGDTQFVLGVGERVGLSGNSGDVSLILDMSFEHRFRKDRRTSAADSPPSADK